MKIYLDKYHLKPYSKETLEVVDEKSYVKARREILSFFLNGQANFKSLHLYKSPYTKWFNDLSEWIETISPKGLLKEKYNNIHLPTNLSDDDIVEMGLIDINIEPTEKEIIKHFWGQSLPSNLSEIENLYIFSRIVIEKKECFNKKYVLKVWEENFKLLSENIDNQLIGIYKPIITLDSDFCSIISEGVYCRKDSVYIENWLYNHSRVFRKYGINTKYLKNLLNDSSIIDISNEQFEKNILSFCTNRLIKKEVLWSNLSGYYNAEITAILSVNPVLKQENVDFLFTKYNEILTDEQKYSLTKLITPTLKPLPFVEDLLFAEQVEKWQDWAINSFIPYKFYLDNQSSELINKELPKIEEASECYSDWLFNNFNTIYRKDSTTTNLDIIIKINEVLEQKKTKIIWLIIDGFPAFYQPMLESILKENGIKKIKTDWSFAVVPTVTEVCIPTMLSGKFESAITEEPTRNQLLITASNHRKCTYTNKVSDFRQNISADVDITCIHTTEIDTLLHKSDSEFEDGRENEVKRIIRKRIEQISEEIKSSTERPIKLVISTDHGATKCLENGKNIKNSKLLEALENDVSNLIEK
jgi:hypothetical protein